jgi:phosphoribosyl-ATP pyrophosphohydrolase/phosphoribosyl-AMP cyclohydrolase
MSSSPGAGGASPGEPDILPLVVLSGGKIQAVARMNSKGCAKSLADGRLWTLHEETGRLLPWEGGGRLLRLVERSGWYEAEVATEAAAEGGGGGAAEPDPGAGLAGPAQAPDILRRLAALIARRRRELPEGSYTTHLFAEGSDKIRKKLGEEAVELILAAERSELVYEAADLIYHLLVLLEDAGVGLDEVLAELGRRYEAG